MFIYEKSICLALNSFLACSQRVRVRERENLANNSGVKSTKRSTCFYP